MTCNVYLKLKVQKNLYKTSSLFIWADMRDPEFEVSCVRESDVIHANKKDVPCIFRVTTSLMDPPGVRHQCLMLADTESEKTKWVVALNELHKILRKNKLPDRAAFRYDLV